MPDEADSVEPQRQNPADLLATGASEEMQDGAEGEQIYTRDIISQYPLGVPRSTYDTKYTTFKREFLERLSEEVGRLFYEHYNGDDFPDAA